MSLAERKLRAEKRVEKIRAWREKKGISADYYAFCGSGVGPRESAKRKNATTLANPFLPWYLTLLGSVGFTPAQTYTEPKKKKQRLIKIPAKI